jgi:phospholipid/cholesterol/gamma-HCH transport system substrate-binding protein
MALSTEKKVGIFFLISLLALGIMIEAVEDWNPFEKRTSYHTYFDSVVGIRAGDPVRMAGVDVGKVQEIRLEEGRVRVDFYVTEETMIKTDSIARIRQTNLLGGQFLGLDFGSVPGEILPPGSALPSEEGSNIDDLITNIDRNQERVLGALGDLITETRGPLSDTVARVENIARKIDEGEGVLGRMVNDPELFDELRAAVGGLGAVVARLEAGEGTMGRLFHDPALYDEALGTLANLQAITQNVRAGEGTLGRLLTDDALYAEAAQTMQEIRELVGRAGQGEGSLARLINDDALYEDTREAMARIASIAAKIDDGQGTIGRLINEDDLYRDAKTTLHKVEKTVDGLSDSGPLSALGVVLGTLF